MALSRSESPVEMSTVTTSELGLGERINEVSRREKRILVENEGEPVAVIVSLADLRAIESADRKRARMKELIAEVSSQFADMSEAELEQEVNDAIAEVELERRLRRESSKT